VTAYAPQLREVRLGEVCGVQTGPFGSQLHASDYKAYGTPIITVEHLGDNRIIHENVPLVSDDDRQRLTRYQLHAGDIVFSRVGAIDRRALVTDLEHGWLFSGRCLRVHPRQDVVHPGFLAHYMGLPHVKNWILNHSVGSTMACLNTDILLRLPLTLPPLALQLRIAAVLNTVDEAIAKTEAVIAKLKQVRAGLLHDLLTRGFDEHRQLRDPIAHPEQFQASPLGQIPRDWGIQNLDAAVRIIDCKHYTPTFVKEGKAFIRPRNVKPEGLDFSDVDFVSDEDFILLTDKHVPNVGDIVFSRNATFGVACYVDQSIPFAIGQDTVVMTHKSASTHFIYYVLCSHLLKAQIMRASSGSTFGRINLAFIRSLLVPNPTQAEQNAIVEKMVAFDGQVKIEESQLTKLTFLKSGLMSDLLTGRVRVPEGIVVAP
jgi:type I restriction enzyme S subunit